MSAVRSTDDTPLELQTALEAMVQRRGQIADPQELRPLSIRFETACKKVNGRLNECFRLVSAGLRSEAVYLADAVPSLRDWTSVTEGTAAQEFRLMLTEAALALPAGVNTDQLVALEAANATLNQLEPLMGEYRRLNLSGADTTSKIVVVRKLAVADSANPAWLSDLRELEVQRFREIHMVMVNNTPVSESALGRMLGDLQSPENHSTPAADLVAKVKSQHDVLRKKRFEKEIATLTPLAVAAYGAMRVDELDDLIREIDYHVQAEGFEVPQQWESQLTGARDWLAERLRIRANDRAFKNDCDALEAMLGKRTSGADLRRQREKVAEYGLDIPDDLAIRARNMQVDVDGFEGRKRAFTAVAASVLIVLSIAGSAFGVWYLQDRSARKSFVATVASQTDAGQLAAATDLFAAAHRDHPRWFSTLAVQSAESDLRTHLKDEQTRHDSFEARLVALQNTSDENLDSPDTVAEYQDLGNAARGQEKDQCARVELAIDERRAQREIFAKQQMSKILKDMAPPLELGVATQDADKLQTAIDDYKKLSEQAHQIKLKDKGLRQQLDDNDKRLGELITKADDLRKEIAQQQRVQQQNQQKQRADQRLLEQACGRLPDVQSYVQALTDAHAASPDGFASTVDLRKFTDLYPPVMDVARHSVLLRQQDVLPTLDLTAQRINSVWGTLLSDKNPQPSPYDAAIKELRRRLKYAQDLPGVEQHFAEQIFSKNYYESAFQAVIQKPDGSQLQCFCLEDAKPVVDASGVHFACFNKLNVINSEPYVAGTTVGPVTISPHSALVRRIEAGMKTESILRGTESQIPGMIEDVLKTADANPKARRALLELLLTLNETAGSPAVIPDKVADQIDSITHELEHPFAPQPVGISEPKFTQATEAFRQIAGTLLTDDWNRQNNEHSVKSALLLQALSRPLSVTGVLVAGQNGGKSIEPVGHAKPAEFWAVVPSSTGPVFQIVALRKTDGSLQFTTDGPPLPNGLPLLSPNDGRSTLALLKSISGTLPIPEASELPACWPANVLQNQKGK